ncbi:hypothetical protein [Bacillus anthracis]|uniref:Uncharacterized protein n=1 Tax=Bacillus anthracis TaxID=1392 RepID=A0A0J1HJZ0_BACAN|nr:hypothetical protein [Bacillus anthracis]KLV14082.1 hypothetical protein ABW01_28895 [Bacillus anthracis]
MARDKNKTGITGFAPDKPKSELDSTAGAFEGLADMSGLNPNQKQEETKQESTSSTKRKTEEPKTDKQGEQTIESKEEPTKESVETPTENKTEEPTIESKTDSSGNTGEEPVEVQEEGSEGETPTGENGEKKSDEDNDEEEEIMTQTKVKKGSVMELFEEIVEPAKELKGYMIEKELIKALEKHGKKIPRKHGGVSALVNRILREGLTQYGMLEEKEDKKK